MCMNGREALDTCSDAVRLTDFKSVLANMPFLSNNDMDFVNDAIPAAISTTRVSMQETSYIYIDQHEQ